MTEGISADIRKQVIVSLLQGKSEDAIRESLTIDSGTLHSLIQKVNQSEIFQAVRSEYRSVARARDVLKLVSLSCEFAPDIERIPYPGTDDFKRHYLATARPVVLTDFTRDWPALNWTPESFRKQYSDVPIEITHGRTSDSEYDRNYKQHLKMTTVGEFVELISNADSPTNDFYIIANNFVLRNTALAGLLTDVSLSTELFDLSMLKNRASLWVGPAGTITSYHYDPGNNMFCQIYGKKRVGLIPPWNLKALNSLRAYHLNEGNYGDEESIIEIGPGDSLFLPAGWFHRIESLSTSISFSTTCFRPHKSYLWYKPGF